MTQAQGARVGRAARSRVVRPVVVEQAAPVVLVVVVADPAVEPVDPRSPSSTTAVELHRFLVEAKQRVLVEPGAVVEPLVDPTAPRAAQATPVSR